MNLLGCTDIDLAKRKAAKLAALKLVWIRLEEHVWRSCSLLSIKIALRSGTVAQRVRRGLDALPLFHHLGQLGHRGEPAVWGQRVNDHRYTLRQCFGELILGDARHLRQCLDDIGTKRRTKLTR
jgi:hypothetical protein